MSKNIKSKFVLFMIGLLFITFSRFLFLVEAIVAIMRFKYELKKTSWLSEENFLPELVVVEDVNPIKINDNLHINPNAFICYNEGGDKLINAIHINKKLLDVEAGYYGNFYYVEDSISYVNKAFLAHEYAHFSNCAVIEGYSKINTKFGRLTCEVMSELFQIHELYKNTVDEKEWVLNIHITQMIPFFNFVLLAGVLMFFGCWISAAVLLSSYFILWILINEEKNLFKRIKSALNEMYSSEKFNLYHPYPYTLEQVILFMIFKNSLNEYHEFLHSKFIQYLEYVKTEYDVHSDYPSVSKKELTEKQKVILSKYDKLPALLKKLI